MTQDNQAADAIVSTPTSQRAEEQEYCHVQLHCTQHAWSQSLLIKPFVTETIAIVNKGSMYRKLYPYSSLQGISSSLLPE